MIMPIWNNYLKPTLIIPAYFNKVSIDVKRYALKSFYILSLDIDFLSDTEIHQAFSNGYIEPKYDIYTERENRYNKLSLLPEWFRNKFIKKYFNTEDLYKIVTTTTITNFEKTLYECKNVDQIAKKVGIFFPTSGDGEEVSHIDYFFENYLQYSNIGTELNIDLFKSIENGTLKKYLSNLTDFQIFEMIGFVHFNSRIELLVKIENLVRRTSTFFIKLSENKEDEIANKKMLFICFGTFNKYIVYSTEQLYGSFSRNKKFIKPGAAKEEFTAWQINELLFLLNYYRDVTMDLLILSNNMLGRIIK